MHKMLLQIPPHGPCLTLTYALSDSHRRCSINKGVLKIFVKFIGKHLYRSFFYNKVAGCKPVTLLKRDSGTGFILLKRFLVIIIIINYFDDIFRKMLHQISRFVLVYCK